MEGSRAGPTACSDILATEVYRLNIYCSMFTTRGLHGNCDQMISHAMICGDAWATGAIHVYLYGNLFAFPMGALSNAN
jgi:hypothetical protein